jgi:hypothetical protein
VLGFEAGDLDLDWMGPDGDPQRSGAAVLVSNNRYRLGRAVGSGTRPRMDDGVLGITVAGASSGPRPWREWSATAFEVGADRPVPAGIDGEALVLDPPLAFRIRPAALRVRVSRAHPGASASALAPEGMWAGVRELGRIAVGHHPTPRRHDPEASGYRPARS